MRNRDVGGEWRRLTSRETEKRISEEELRALPRFARLLIYDEHDERADSITRLQPDGKYNKVREATTLPELHDLLADDKYEPLGGVRYEEAGKVAIFTYFREKRS